MAKRKSKKSYDDWSDFDVISFLEDNNIGYDTAGKNIGQGHIGLNECPLCGVGGNHFGIRMDTNVGTCFVCGESAGAPRLVREITNLPWREVYAILKEGRNEDRWIPASPVPGADVVFPDGIVLLNSEAGDYLWGRKFDPDFIKRKYKVKCTERKSYLEIEPKRWDFSHRIIIPIIMEKELVSYAGRSYIGKDPRYMNSPTQACLIPPASCIYNIDTVKNKAILMEGITDVWRMGNETVAMMGKKFTDEQIHYLGTRNLDEAYVLYDPGAEEEALKLCKALVSVVPYVRNITLTKDCDPGDLESVEAMQIKYELLGRV